MRLKVRINVQNPLQQSWRVRANVGNFVQILFKYEKLGIFCYLCGLLGHTDKNCPKLFDMDHDDGVRQWGENLRPLINRMGTAATNKYLKDLIPSNPQTSHNMDTGSQHTAAATPNAAHTPSAAPAGNFDGRIIVVQREISAIKSGLLSAQKQAMVKSGKNLNGASASHNSVVLSATASQAVFPKSHQHSMVQGMLAEPPTITHGEDSLSLEATDMDETGAELKKRKRAKATEVNNDAEHMTIGAEGLDAVGTSAVMGGNVIMSMHDNPMFDVTDVTDVTETTDVTAGPDVQACRKL
jgi:hypothetical protein